MRRGLPAILILAEVERGLPGRSGPGTQKRCEIARSVRNSPRAAPRMGALRVKMRIAGGFAGTRAFTFHWRVNIGFWFHPLFPLGDPRNTRKRKALGRSTCSPRRRAGISLQPSCVWCVSWAELLLYFSAPLNRNGARPVISALVNVGHQNFSTCSTTRSVPAKWLTKGFFS